jgi:hypothetical protein
MCEPLNLKPGIDLGLQHSSYFPEGDFRGGRGDFTSPSGSWESLTSSNDFIQVPVNPVSRNAGSWECAGPFRQRPHHTSQPFASEFPAQIAFEQLDRAGDS